VSTASSTGERDVGSHLGGLRGLYARFAHLIHEFGKFGTVGAVCYAIDLGVFTLWRTAFGQPFTAVVVSTVIATSVAFLGNRFWTWRHRDHGRMHHQYLLYFGFNLVGMVVSLACLWVSHYVLGAVWDAFQSLLADTISAKIVGVMLASLFRFWAYRRYIFPKAPPTEIV
jgi:putative flippase GtrA